MANRSPVDFREVAAALHGAVIGAHHLDLSAGRLEFSVKTTKDDAQSVTLIFAGITILNYRGGGTGASAAEIAVIGLERLGSGEPWRLYVEMRNAAELELTCRDIHFGDIQVAGVGRSYRR